MRCRGTDDGSTMEAVYSSHLEIFINNIASICSVVASLSQGNIEANLERKSIMTKAAPLSIAESPVEPNHWQFKPHIRFPSRRCMPAVWMRSGTSKGLFIHQTALPPSPKLWESILLSAMGSAHGNTRQIDGVGGATSTTSKAAIVVKSTRAHADVDYTFVQVAPDRAGIDMTGNCGNMASGVGPFALDEGIVRAAPGQKEVGTPSFSWAKHD